MRKVMCCLAGMLLIAACQTTGGSNSLADYKAGDVVPEKRNQWIMLELLTVAQNGLTDRIYNNRENIVKAMNVADRESRGKFGSYKITNRLSRDLDILMGAENDEISIDYLSGCTFDIVIHDVDPKQFGKTMLLAKGHISTGKYLEAKAVPGNPRAVRYNNLTVVRLSSLVLPIGHGVWGDKPSIVFIAKNTNIKTPDSKDGKSRRVYVGHRTDKARGVNTAITVALAVDRCQT